MTTRRGLFSLFGSVLVAPFLTKLKSRKQVGIMVRMSSDIGEIRAAAHRMVKMQMEMLGAKDIKYYYVAPGGSGDVLIQYAYYGAKGWIFNDIRSLGNA